MPGEGWGSTQGKSLRELRKSLEKAENRRWETCSTQPYSPSGDILSHEYLFYNQVLFQTVFYWAPPSAVPQVSHPHPASPFCSRFLWEQCCVTPRAHCCGFPRSSSAHTHVSEFQGSTNIPGFSSADQRCFVHKTTSGLIS